MENAFRRCNSTERGLSSTSRIVSCSTALECTSGFRGCLGPEEASRGLGIGEPPNCCVRLDNAPETACYTQHIADHMVPGNPFKENM